MIVELCKEAMALYFEMSLFNRIIIGVFDVMCNDNLIMVDINKVPMVRVTGLDARDMETGWLSEKEIVEAPLAKCQEVGWLMANNKEKIVVMRSWCIDKDDNHGGGAIAIPKGWVTKIEYLGVEYGERSDDQ